jgi:hypothetical protein
MEAKENLKNEDNKKKKKLDRSESANDKLADKPPIKRKKKVI